MPQSVTAGGAFYTQLLQIEPNKTTAKELAPP